MLALIRQKQPVLFSSFSFTTGIEWLISKAVPYGFWPQKQKSQFCGKGPGKTKKNQTKTKPPQNQKGRKKKKRAHHVSCLVICTWTSMDLHETLQCFRTLFDQSLCLFSASSKKHKMCFILFCSKIRSFLFFFEKITCSPQKRTLLFVFWNKNKSKTPKFSWEMALPSVRTKNSFFVFVFDHPQGPA